MDVLEIVKPSIDCTHLLSKLRGLGWADKLGAINPNTPYGFFCLLQLLDIGKINVNSLQLYYCMLSLTIVVHGCPEDVIAKTACRYSKFGNLIILSGTYRTFHSDFITFNSSGVLDCQNYAKAIKTLFLQQGLSVNDDKIFLVEAAYVS